MTAIASWTVEHLADVEALHQFGRPGIGQDAAIARQLHKTDDN